MTYAPGLPDVQSKPCEEPQELPGKLVVCSPTRERLPRIERTPDAGGGALHDREGFGPGGTGAEIAMQRDDGDNEACLGVHDVGSCGLSGRDEKNID